MEKKDLLLSFFPSPPLETFFFCFARARAFLLLLLNLSLVLSRFAAVVVVVVVVVRPFSLYSLSFVRPEGRKERRGERFVGVCVSSHQTNEPKLTKIFLPLMKTNNNNNKQQTDGRGDSRNWTVLGDED